MVTLYREIKIKKNIFFLFLFFYIYITFFRAGRGVGAALTFSTIFILSICVFLINIAKFCRKNAAPRPRQPPFAPQKTGHPVFCPIKKRGRAPPFYFHLLFKTGYCPDVVTGISPFSVYLSLLFCRLSLLLPFLYLCQRLHILIHAVLDVQ